MLSDTIPPNSTIADVARSLRNPVEYVRKVLENFMASGLDREKALVRIGVAGRGIMPNYKIEYPTEIQFEDTLTIPLQATFEIYDGKSHKRMTAFTIDDVREKHWSERAMTLSEIQQLIGSLRGQR